MDGKWVNVKKACEIYNVSHNTIRKWGDNNFIECKRTPSGHRIFFISEHGVHREKIKPKGKYLYVRVSSKKQENDLSRQLLFLHDKYPNHSIIKDIGSGLNYKRKGLLSLIEQSNKGLVEEIVVYSKDRLCRFGFELLEFVFKQNDTRIVVYEQIDKSPEQEFTEDILAILQVFACRWNGKRKYSIKSNNGCNEIQVEIEQSPKEITKQVE